jgi:hypothetical protein
MQLLCGFWYSDKDLIPLSGYQTILQVLHSDKVMIPSIRIPDNFTGFAFRYRPGLIVIKLSSMSVILVLEKHPIRAPYPINQYSCWTILEYETHVGKFHYHET